MQPADRRVMAAEGLTYRGNRISTYESIDASAFTLDQELWDKLQTPTILIVDESEINRRLLKAMLKAAPYRILEARRASEALAHLETEKIDLVIVDLIIPEMSGPEFCRWIKSNRHTQLLPILMLTNVQGTENEIAGIASGADEFLIKPLHPAVVRTRIRAMLRNKAAIDSLEQAETILFALAQAVEQRDKYNGRPLPASGDVLGGPGYGARPGQERSAGPAPRRIPARHRQDWGAGRGAVQAGAAQRGRVAGDEVARGEGGGDLPAHAEPGAGAAHHPQPPREVGRDGLPRRVAGAADPAVGAHPAGGGHLRRAHHRAGPTRRRSLTSRRSRFWSRKCKRAGAIRTWCRCSPNCAGGQPWANRGASRSTASCLNGRNWRRCSLRSIT